MRKMLRLSAILSGLLLVNYAWSQQPGDAKAIIEKAVKAEGGADKVVRGKTTHMKGKGTISIGGADLAFKVESMVQLPGQSKSIIKLEAMGQEVNIVEVLNGNKGWVSINGEVMETDEPSLASLKENLYAANVILLVPLLKEKGFELTALGDSKVDGKAVAGVKVASKGQKDIQLFFDKESGLLVKSTRQAVDPINKQAVTQDDLYSNYKEVDGVKQPHRVVVNQDGKKFLDAEVTFYAYVPSFDAKTFDAPKGKEK